MSITDISLISQAICALVTAAFTLYTLISVIRNDRKIKNGKSDTIRIWHPRPKSGRRNGSHGRGKNTTK